MPILVYRTQEFETTHERQFIEDFVTRLSKEYSSEGDTVIVLENYLCDSNQIDATILKNDGIIVLEFKNYCGEIIFSENGDWIANGVSIKGGRDKRNPCQQVRAYKYSLMNFLKEHADKILIQSREIEWGHISGMVIFHQPIKFDKGTIPQPLRPWFHITDLQGSINIIKTITSPKLFLTDEELKRIPILLGLKAVPEGAIPNVDTDNSVKRDCVDTFVVSDNIQAEPSEIPIIIPKATAKRRPRKTRTEKIIDYYLRCLELEDIKRSELQDNPDIVMWMPSEAPNLLEDRLKSILIEEKHSFFNSIKNEEKRERPRSLFFGYPVLRVTEEKGKILPIFLCQLQYDESSRGLILKRIPEEDYVINRTVFQFLGIKPEEVEETSLEIFQLSTLEERIEFLNRYHDLRIPPTRRSIIFLNESSDFTSNLVEELDILIKPSNLKSLKSTPAKFLIDEDHIKEQDSTSSERLFEVFPMNDAQRNSVKRAFDDQFTVVTGPPGTGKSQVVLNIFANAIIQGKTVLFASKINNAVDIVNEKFLKHVIDTELLVRIGNKKLMESIKGNLKSLSNRILNKQINVEEKEVKEAQLELLEEEREIEAGQSKLEELRILPARIAENEKVYNECVQTYNDEMTKLASEKKQIENKKREKLESIPTEILQAIYFDLKSPSLRKKDIEDLRFRAYSLLTKEGLTIFNRILRWLMPSLLIKKLRDCLFAQEKNIPTELLNWMDAKSPDTSTFEGLLNRIETILQILKWDNDIQGARNLESCIDTLDKKINSKCQEFNTLKEKLKDQIDTANKLYDQLKRDEKVIRTKIETAQNKKITLTRKYINTKWKHKISNNIAGQNIGKLANYFQNRAAIAALTNTFSDVLNYLPLWSVASLSVRNGIPLRPAIFDLLVVDEAASCDIPSAIPLFFRCKKVIVIGDPMQLKHISSVTAKEDDRLAKDAECEDLPYRYSRESLYDRVESVAINSGKRVEFLEEHFRCQEKIIQFSNIFVYLPRTGHELIVKTPLRTFDSQQTLSWVNVRGKIHEIFKSNPLEIEKILETLKRLVPKARENNLTVGVTTPFRHQVKNLIDKIPNSYRNIVTVDTIHKFQGNEKDIMVFSPVISTGARKSMINFINVDAPQLLNVAVTRARIRLIIVGDFDACYNAGGLLKHLAIYIQENGELIDYKESI